MTVPLLQLLDGITVRRRRVQMGLSAAALAAALGTTQQVIYRLEHGMRQNDLDVSFIVDLAAVLAVSPRQLLLDEAISRQTPTRRPVGNPSALRPETTAATREPASSGNDALQATDCQRVASVLAEVGRWVYVDDLAESLEWTGERALLALQTLGGLLPAVGQRLAWLNDCQVRLCGDLDAEPALREVTSRDIAISGVNVDESRTLFLMVNGAVPPRHRASLTAITRLTRLGHIEADPTPRGRRDDLPRLTAQARYDLCLEELGLDGSRKLKPRRRKPDQER